MSIPSFRGVYPVILWSLAKDCGAQPPALPCCLVCVLPDAPMIWLGQISPQRTLDSPFAPISRLPPSITGQAVEDILGTDVDGLDDNPVSYLQSPVIASPRSATHQGSLSPLLAGMSPPSLSAGPGGPNRTTRLLNNVRSYLETGGTERPPATVLLLPGASNGQPQQQQQP